MAVIVGAFLGGPDTTLEAGTASISLSINTTDRLNLDTASWTITAPGFSKTVQADASGRGYIVVPSGKTYTVTLTHTGKYENDGPQTVITESKMNYGVLFDLFSFESFKVLVNVSVTSESEPAPGINVIATNGENKVSGVTNGNGVASMGLPGVGNWTISLEGYNQSKELVVDQLIENISFEVGSLDVEVVPDNSTITISGPITVSKVSSGNHAIFGPLPQGDYTVSSAYESKTVNIGVSREKITVLTRKPIVYGFKIEESTSDPYGRVTYTDDAIGIQPAYKQDMGGWANTELFQKIKPVIRYPDGTFKDLNKRDFSKCTDGSTSNMYAKENVILTEFPTWYIHMHAENGIKYVKLCKYKLDDTYHAMHAMDNGIQRNCFHLGCYQAYMYGGKACSTPSEKPHTNKSPEELLSLCKATGKGFDDYSWFQRNYICALFTLAYKSCDSQSVLGMGIVGKSGVETQYMSNFYNDFGLAGENTQTQPVSFLWLINVWGNAYHILSGALTNSQNQLMVILDGKDSSFNEADFVAITPPKEGRGAFVKEMNMSDSKIGFFPEVTGGSSSTYWCDRCSINASRIPRAGGYYDGHDGDGLYEVCFCEQKSQGQPFFCARLMYKGGRDYDSQ